MEKKKLKVMFNKSGSGSITTRLAIPKSWLDKMGVSIINQYVEVEFEDNQIIIKKEEVDMNLEGMKWGELSKLQQDELLKMANCINGATGNDLEEGECIVDLTDELSVSGRVVNENDELITIIEDNAILYNPSKGVITR